MPDTPRVSIIMPTLNCAAHLDEAIESIRSQSHPDWELLIMDAVSTDGTVELARSYGDPRIRISTEPDEGIVHAWDKGAKRARGDHIALLCGNDAYVDADFLSSAVEAMDEDPEVSLVWGVPCVLTEGEHKLNPHPWGQFVTHPERIDRYQKHLWLFNWLATGAGFWDGGMCTRREVFRACMPDYVLGTRIHDKLFPFFYNFSALGYLPLGLPRVVSFYRAHGDSLFASEAVTNAMHVSVQDYARRVRRYRADLIAGRRVHTYRDGKGQPLGELRWPEDVTADDLRVSDLDGKPIDGTKQLEAAFPRS